MHASDVGLMMCICVQVQFSHNEIVSHCTISNATGCSYECAHAWAVRFKMSRIMNTCECATLLRKLSWICEEISLVCVVMYVGVHVHVRVCDLPESHYVNAHTFKCGEDKIFSLA